MHKIFWKKHLLKNELNLYNQYIVMDGHVSLHINVDKNGRMFFKTLWEDKDLMKLLGGVAIAKKWLEDEITSLYAQDERNVKADVQRNRMTKDDAMKLYIAIGEQIQKRLVAMNNADDRATFDVPTDLLNHI